MAGKTTGNSCVASSSLICVGDTCFRITWIPRIVINLRRQLVMTGPWGRCLLGAI